MSINIEGHIVGCEANHQNGNGLTKNAIIGKDYVKFFLRVGKRISYAVFSYLCSPSISSS